MIPKPTRWVNKKYESWVASLPCANCGHPDSHVHHIKGIGNFSGGSLKAPSWAVMPLCASCHDYVHRNPKSTAEDQLIYALRTLGKAVESGHI